MFRVLLLFAVLSKLLSAADENNTVEPEPEWSIGMVVRTATIPYKTSEDFNSTVSTLIPYITYEGKYFYLRGLEGGGHLFKDDALEVNLFSRLRFVDIPVQLQNELQLDTFDLGLQAQYNFAQKHYIEAELMSDTKRNAYANLRYLYRYQNRWLDLQPSVQLRFKSSDFNSYYYGLDREAVDAGVSAKIGIGAKVHLISNAYLVATASHEWLDTPAKNSSAVGADSQTEVFAGIEVGQERSRAPRRRSKRKEFIRLDMGFGTISDFEDTVFFNRKKDIYNNKLTSINYGIQLSDSLFTLPIQPYLINGFTYHWTSEVQPKNLYEYTIAFEIFYTIPLPWRVRLGAAEGFSWISDITYLEKRDGELEGFKSSKFLNYLETGIEVSLGDIFGKEAEPFWFGTGVHHRSSIYLLASQYGRQRVGSNYYTYYLKWEFTP